MWCDLMWWRAFDKAKKLSIRIRISLDNSKIDGCIIECEQSIHFTKYITVDSHRTNRNDCIMLFFPTRVLSSTKCKKHLLYTLNNDIICYDEVEKKERRFHWANLLCVCQVGEILQNPKMGTLLLIPFIPIIICYFYEEKTSLSPFRSYINSKQKILKHWAHTSHVESVWLTQDGTHV